MEQLEKLPLINELCYLAAQRNAINTRRHRARYRKNYYAHALRVVEAHNNSNYELRSLRERLAYANGPNNQNNMKSESIKLQARIAAIEDSMLFLRERHPKPKKWQKLGLHKLRSLILQGEGEYATAKHQTMEFTIKSRSRVQYLTSTLNCRLIYSNGSIEAIIFDSDDMVGVVERLSKEEFSRYADQHELNKAVQSMVEE
jgi:hypothetical protein